MNDVVVVSGQGRYRDPWHDFAGTSERVAQIVSAAGWSVQVCGVASTDPIAARLIIVNAGGGGPALAPVEGDSESRWRAAVLAHAAAGGPVLALHAAANTFYEDDRWEQIIGGRWVPGTSHHPPGGPARVQVAVEHPITAGLPDEIDIVDERYSYLRVGDITTLVSHQHEGLMHPMVWAFDGGGTTAVVDTLGHDVAAYGDVRAELLRREVQFLLR